MTYTKIIMGVENLTETKRRSYGNVSHTLNILLLFKKEKELSLGEIAELLQLRKSYVYFAIGKCR